MYRIMPDLEALFDPTVMHVLIVLNNGVITSTSFLILFIQLTMHDVSFFQYFLFGCRW